CAPGSVNTARATDCWPSRVQDWLYCSVPSSIRGFLVLGSTVTTSLSRTMPVAGGVGPLGLVRFTRPAVLPAGEADIPVCPAPADIPVCPTVDPDLPAAALTMMSANC